MDLVILFTDFHAKEAGSNLGVTFKLVLSFVCFGICGQYVVVLMSQENSKRALDQEFVSYYQPVPCLQGPSS